MIKTPSHRVHEIVGKMICHFSSKYIDVLIDGERGGHDKGRRDCGKLLEQATEIRNKYGENGLCYYVLHHYLDKIVSIIRCRFTRILLKYGRLPLEERFKYLPIEVKEGLLDEVSTLSSIDKNWQWPYSSIISKIISNKSLSLLDIAQLISDSDVHPAIRYPIYREYVNKGYSKKTAKKKAEARLRITKSCFDYDFSDFPELKLQVRNVRSNLIHNLEKVICIIFSIDRKDWLKWFGKDYYNRIVNALNCSNYLKEVESENTC